jgi:hypothetical protein
MSSLTIRWQPTELADRCFGHGFGIYAGSKRRYERLAAFVEGFAWLRGGKEAVVLFDPELVSANEQEFAAFKAAVEARIRAGHISDSEVLPGYWGSANA